jgi:hypothetical protein
LSIFRVPPKKARKPLETHPFDGFAANLHGSHAHLTGPWNREEIEEVITQGNTMNRSWLRLLCAGALALTSLVSLSAHAQYSWVDDKGARVFSDRPPPPDTPAARILKAPREFQATVAPAAPAAPAAEPAAKTSVPTWTEREADYRKRAAEREKVEQEGEAKRRTEHAAQCSSARAAQAQLTTSRRVVRANPKGEREFMSDDDRARELEKVQRTLQGCS